MTLLMSQSSVSADLAKTSGLLSHNTIYINTNAGFTGANGVTGGTGTDTNPYIIEGWNITITNFPHPFTNWSDAFCISFFETSEYVIIRNVSLSGGASAIKLLNVTNVKIRDSYVNSTYNNEAMHIESCTNIDIISNYIGGGGGGISIAGSADVNISGNYVTSGASRTKGAPYSMIISSLNWVYVADNDFSHGGNVSAYSCDNATVKNNIWSDQGIFYYDTQPNQYGNSIPSNGNILLVGIAVVAIGFISVGMVLFMRRKKNGRH
jgi:hypothetical protein